MNLVPLRTESKVAAGEQLSASSVIVQSIL